ncbi:DUF2924 domain-containing protein [Ruegeria sp. PrR005]|uniref:DUF2924 domain-containing protein n=1 Tax=Ruegeria sp. PrR005 TaxID=2706882 RepID=A0A6B2NSQ1_9RHOB|nr:DUF2924 domain-containing protein [Ruegeria sp. PrR005]NDW45424.1 DUF2924 domain-containing protein [Ruegeria sp. PrR005]
MKDLTNVARTETGKAHPIPLPSVATLETAGRETLLDHWRDIFAAPPPKGLSQVFLRRFLAFEVQARQQGGLPKDLVERIAREAAGETRKVTPALRPGGRLLREWNGVTHVVDILEAGCLWQGKTYPSLSAVARAITGARWSGPRFFGLTTASETPSARRGTNGKGAKR